jgi:hypothetical protein
LSELTAQRPRLTLRTLHPGKRDTEQRAQGYRVHSALPEEAFPSTRALARRLAKRPGEREFTRGLRGVLAGFANNRAV